MIVARGVADVREALRDRDGSVGLVPTMGALHGGHLALLAAARESCHTVVMSLFVNPAQFGDPADLNGYPRDEAKDIEIARKAGVDIVFAPSAFELYPPGYQTWVEVTELGAMLEGEHRPGHFRGVATICLKLFTIVRPDVAFFGQKDAQQVEVLRQMIRDLHLEVDLEVVQTVRDTDGLALSSRNVRLSTEERTPCAGASPRTRDPRRRHRARDPRRGRPRGRLRRCRALRPSSPCRRRARRRHPTDRQRPARRREVNR